MAQHVSDEQVKAARDRVDNLRQEIAQEQGKISASARSEENAYRKDKLDAEAERYERQLSALRAQSSSSTVTPPPPTESRPAPPTDTVEDDEKE